MTNSADPDVKPYFLWKKKKKKNISKLLFKREHNVSCKYILE